MPNKNFLGFMQPIGPDDCDHICCMACSPRNKPQRISVTFQGIQNQICSDCEVLNDVPYVLDLSTGGSTLYPTTCVWGTIDPEVCNYRDINGIRLFVSSVSRTGSPIGQAVNLLIGFIDFLVPQSSPGSRWEHTLFDLTPPYNCEQLLDGLVLQPVVYSLSNRQCNNHNSTATVEIVE